MAQRAARTTSPVAYVGLAQRNQCRAEVHRIGGDIQRVHAIADPIRPPLPEKLGDPAEPRVFARIQPLAAEDDGIHNFPGSQLLDSALDPGVLSLTEHHPRIPARGPLEQTAAEAHARNRRASALATSGCTSSFTSPPNLATSRTRLELR
jgi:hypothetical protein